ncbi:hypothetical protein ACIO93_44115 [Streptomyces sp. NPDC087903]|uniref:hypothetical protein n=1 Tax=Streptomyces sp. NPDC087903 TaxID=3365819 RepID=UPI00380BDCC6
MPEVGWSVGQRAAVKRWMMFVYLFAVAGLILSILLIVMGNSGGWILLALTVCIAGAAYMFVGNIRKRQPH